MNLLVEFPLDLNKSTLNSELNASEQAYFVLSLHVKLAAEITIMSTCFYWV